MSTANWKKNREEGNVYLFFFSQAKCFTPFFLLLQLTSFLQNGLNGPRQKRHVKSWRELYPISFLFCYTHTFIIIFYWVSPFAMSFFPIKIPLSTGFLSNTWEEIFSLTKKKKTLEKKKGKQPPYPWIKVSICREEPVGHTLPCATLRKRHPPHTHTKKKERKSKPHVTRERNTQKTTDYFWYSFFARLCVCVWYEIIPFRKKKCN